MRIRRRRPVPVVNTPGASVGVASRGSRFRAIAATLVVIVLAAAVYAALPVNGVCLVYGGGRRLVAAVPPGAEVTLQYRHSVARSTVREVFVLPDSGGFRLDRTEYRDFGAGLPSGGSGDFVYEDGWFIYSGYDLAMNEIPLRVTEGSEQTLTAQDNPEIVFLDFLEPNSTVVIETCEMPRIGTILGTKGVR